MSDSTEGAGPALAAHSKDASTAGQNPASSVTGKAKPPPEGGEAAQRMLQEAADLVRAQPVVAMGVFIAAGLIAARLLSR